MECCNAPDTIFHIGNSESCLFRRCDTILLSWLGFVFCFAFYSCQASHIMSSYASHLHTCSSHASEHFPCCPFCNPTLPRALAHPSCLFSCAGVKRSRNRPRLAKWPLYNTGRPPVKFRAIWRLFDTPTVNRVTAKASFGLQPNTPSKQPNNPSKSLPCSPSSHHDRMGENYTSFGHS